MFSPKLCTIQNYALFSLYTLNLKQRFKQPKTHLNDCFFLNIAENTTENSQTVNLTVLPLVKKYWHHTAMYRGKK